MYFGNNLIYISLVQLYCWKACIGCNISTPCTFAYIGSFQSPGIQKYKDAALYSNSSYSQRAFLLCTICPHGNENQYPLLIFCRFLCYYSMCPGISSGDTLTEKSDQKNHLDQRKTFNRIIITDNRHSLHRQSAESSRKKAVYSGYCKNNKSFRCSSVPDPHIKY